MNDLGICILAIAKSVGILLLYSGSAIIIIIAIVEILLQLQDFIEKIAGEHKRRR